jgi:undecaprenyl-diphosphatase
MDVISLIFNLLHQAEQFVIDGDHNYFFHINQQWTNSWFDSFMPFITDPHRAWPFVAIGILYMVYKKKIKVVPILLGCIISIALSDIVAARVIKPLVHRERPEASEKQIRLLVPHQGSFGFPSNHAANMFAAATFLTCTFPSIGLITIAAAIVVAYSRVYVGVHYPLDVFCGGLLGTIIALVIYRIYILLRDTVDPIKDEKTEPKSWEKKGYKLRS